MLRAVLDGAWNSLNSEQQACALKSDMAVRILALAGEGVRDTARLRRAAVMGAGDKRPAAQSARRGTVSHPNATKSRG
jgi:hypothetical protein